MTVKQLLCARLATKELPPRVRNSIAIEIMLLVALSRETCCKLTIKSLFAELAYSTMAVRSHFNMLMENGYINTECHEYDGRVKYVIITTRGEIVVHKYLSCVSELIQQYTLETTALDP